MPPQSKLTYERPDIWLRALAMATDLTGYRYPPKVPTSVGTLSACGGGPFDPTKFIEWQKNRIKELEERIKRIENGQDDPSTVEHLRTHIKHHEGEIERIRGRYPDVQCLSVPVPEGAMEWLLHEVGHWVAATPEERLLPDYGYGIVKQKGWGAAREWQAWGFEEIILSPFGASRLLAPPEHRGGTAFAHNGPIPGFATAHAERRMRELRIDRDQWRTLYSEWFAWADVAGQLIH